MRMIAYKDGDTKRVMLLEGGCDESETRVHESLREFGGALDVMLIDMKTVPAWLVRILGNMTGTFGGRVRIGVTEEGLSRYLTSLAIPHTLFKSEETWEGGREPETTMDRRTMESFLEKVKVFSGNDFTGYDIEGVKRVIGGIIGKYGLGDFGQFEERIFQNRKFHDRFIDAMSIGHSTFFRDSAFFRALREDVLKRLDAHPRFKIWSVGCANGMEPYSVAIMLEEAGILDRGIIYATDFSETLLCEARNGFYSKADFEAMGKAYAAMGGAGDPKTYVADRGGYVEIVPRIRNNVHFFHHDVSIDTSFNTFELILCRNVLIYFDDTLKRKVLKLLHASLTHDGYLGLGASEGIHHYLDRVNFVLYKDGVNIYRKAIKGVRKAEDHETV